MGGCAEKRTSTFGPLIQTMNSGQTMTLNPHLTVHFFHQMPEIHESTDTRLSPAA